MKQVITLPTGDFTCSLSSGCGANGFFIAVASSVSTQTSTGSSGPTSVANAAVNSGDTATTTNPSPAPDAALPGGWRGECVVQRSSDGNFDVINPARDHYLRRTATESVVWEEYDTTGINKLPIMCITGSFDSESSARAALAAAQPWPGYQPPAPSKPEFPDVAGGVPLPTDMRRDLSPGEIYTARSIVGSNAHRLSAQPTPAPSPVEGEPANAYEIANSTGEAWRREAWNEAADAWRDHTASLRSSLAAARAEVASLKVQVLNLEDAESLFESTRASNAKLRADLAALKVLVERSERVVGLYERWRVADVRLKEVDDAVDAFKEISQ